MAWFRLDDKFHMNRKVVAAGNAAVGLYSRCGTYCADHLTDGLVPRDIARLYGTRKEITTLIDKRMWVEVEDGYLMPDYLTFNPSREDVLRERAASAERQRRARDAAKSRRDGGVTNGVTTGVSHGPPVPTRPDPSPSVSPSSSSLKLVPPPDDDDMGTYRTTLAIIVKAKENDYQPRSPKAWRATVLADTDRTEGNRIRTALANGSDPIDVAGQVLGSTSAALVAADQIARSA